MRLRWTTDAAEDFERIVDHIKGDRPGAALRVAETVLDRIGTLEAFPHIGRAGRVNNTRELVLPSLPFVVVYEVFAARDEVCVLRILHGAQRWPPL
jgi:toxin ParE1/3/4